MAKKHKKNKKNGNAVTTNINEMIKVVPISKIQISRYDMKTWKTIYNGTEADYIERMIPYDYLEYLYQSMITIGVFEKQGDTYKIAKNIPHDMPVQTAVIDAEYMDWLKENVYADSPSMRNKYMGIISDEKSFELLKKNELNLTYEMNIIPLIAYDDEPLPSTTDWNLKEKRKEITEILETLYGTGNVYVPGYVCKNIDLFDDTSQIINEALHGFHGIKIRNIKYETQNHAEKVNAELICVPFIVKHEVTQSSLTVAQIFGEDTIPEEYKITNDMIYFDYPENDEGKDESYEKIFSFVDTGLENTINDGLKNIKYLNILPFWINIEELPTYTILFTELIKAAVEEEKENQSKIQ